MPRAEKVENWRDLLLGVLCDFCGNRAAVRCVSCGKPFCLTCGNVETQICAECEEMEM